LKLQLQKLAKPKKSVCISYHMNPPVVDYCQFKQRHCPQKTHKTTIYMSHNKGTSIFE